MFGKNEIVGRKYFDNAGDKLFVTSVFYTLQGEGPFRGHPAVFVRLAKCNLACSFCDTWFDSGDWLTLDQLSDKIYNAISSFYKGNIPEWLMVFNKGLPTVFKCGLVVTGGEPMLQNNLVPMLESFQHSFAWTQIESNGILYQEIPSSTVLVCSPKCAEKNGKPTKYLSPSPYTTRRANCLKFVMNNDPDSPYSSVPDWALNWSRTSGRPIFVSPMNIYNKEPERNKANKNQNCVTLEQRSVEDEVISFWEPGLLNMEANQANHEYAAKYCMEHNCILNLQIHLYASLA